MQTSYFLAKPRSREPCRGRSNSVAKLLNCDTLLQICSIKNFTDQLLNGMFNTVHRLDRAVGSISKVNRLVNEEEITCYHQMPEMPFCSVPSIMAEPQTLSPCMILGRSIPLCFHGKRRTVRRHVCNERSLNNTRYFSCQRSKLD